MKTITYENNGELDSSLNEEERQKSISLMRVNASGEVSAQALYRGQAFFTKTPDVRKHLIKTVCDAGADTFVLGSAIFNTDDYASTITDLRNNIR